MKRSESSTSPNTVSTSPTRQLSLRVPLVTIEDTRVRYGEARYVALGLLGEIVVSLVYTERLDRVRIISIRKALRHEARFFFSQIGK
ncbi:MAG TPA: BrnT family toxin [Casimicrobiaceae bacterium]|nr:BrnT family toxin [Casimicrobiaceae bacterium]